MKKNFKLAFIALLIVALSLCTLLTACSEKHEHSYTELDHDATNHWYYCAEDDEIDETSVQAHKFDKVESDTNQHWKVCSVCGVAQSSKANHVDADENGKCDVCQHTVPIPIKYGTISGTINLCKAGETTPAGSDVTLILSDGKGEVTPIDLVVGDGKFSFTAVQGEYTLKASVEGYIEASYTIELAKDAPVTDYEIDLDYNLLSVTGADGNLHDFAHQNDENAYVVFDSSIAGKSLNFTTVDTMDDAMFTWYAKSGLSFNGEKRVGVWAIFDDNGTPNFALFTVKGSANAFEWYGAPKEWEINNALSGVWGFEGNALSADEIAQYEAGTLQVGIARHENMLFAIVNGQIRDTRILPEKYATMPCRLGMAGFDAGCEDGEAKFNFSISTDIEKYLPTDTFTVTVPTVENLTITPSRTSGHKGQGVDLTLEPADGYSLVSIKIGDTEKLADVVDGVLSVANYNGEAITAQVIKNAEVDAEVTATGLDGAKLIFKQGETENEVTVADDVAKFHGSTGIWNVSTTYQGATFDLGKIVIDTDGKATLSKTEVTLFNSTDMFWNSNNATDIFDLATGKGEVTLGENSDPMAHLTSVQYGDVAFTTYLDATATKEGQGIIMLFGNKYIWVATKNECVDRNYVKEDGHYVLDAIEWNCNTWMHDGSLVNLGSSTKEAIAPNEWWFYTSTGAAAYQGKDSFKDVKELFVKGELKLTLVRHGKMIYVFLNDKYIGLRNVGDDLAETPVNCGMSLFGAKDGTGKAKYAIETDISSYLAKCEGDSSFKYEVSGDNIVVTGKNEGFKVNDLAEISFKAEDAYRITAIKVDGVEVNVETTSYKVWVNSPSMANVKIEIETALRTGYPVATEVTATGLDGATLTFTQGETTKTATVTDGVAKFEGATGAWDVTVSYQNQTFSLGTVNVGADGKATLSKTDVTLFNEFDVFNWGKPTVDKFNVATGEGELYLTAGENIDVMMHTTSVGYGDVAITMYLAPNAGGDSEGLFMLFGNKDIRVFFEKVNVEGKTILKAIKWSGDTTRNDNKPENITMNAPEVFGSSWQFHNTTGEEIYDKKDYFTDEEQELFANGQLKFTLVRHGKMIYAFFNDKYIGLRNLSDYLTEETKVNCGLSMFGVGANHTRKVKYAIETDISSYLAKCEGDATVSSSSEHVTVVTPADIKVNSLIDISFNVDAGYVITEISVDGRSYDPYQKSIKIWVNRPNFEVEITAVPTSQVSELEHNRIGDRNQGFANMVDNSTPGQIKTTGATTLLENTRLEYGDGAISLTLKKNQFPGGTAGVGYAFGGGDVGNDYGNNEKDSLLFRVEEWNDTSAGVQWVGTTWFGLDSIHQAWNIDNGIKGYGPLSDDLFNAYAKGTGLTISVARIGDTVYALVDGKIVSTQSVCKYSGKLGRFFLLVPDAKADETFNYQLYSATEAATLIANAKTVISGEAETPITKVIGSVSYTEAGITFDGSGVVEVGNGSLNESLTISVGDKYSTNDANKMGIMYRFANGKFLFIRSEKPTDGSPLKVQFSQESTFHRAGDAFLQGWKDFALTDSAINSFYNDSLNLTLERNGKVFTVKLGDTVLDTITLGDEYATMAGQMMIDVQNGNVANAFTFTYADNSTAE